MQETSAVLLPGSSDELARTESFLDKRQAVGAKALRLEHAWHMKGKACVLGVQCGAMQSEKAAGGQIVYNLESHVRTSSFTLSEMGANEGC